MKKSKSSLIIVTAIALVALLAIGMTLAYLTDQRTTTNVLRIGQDGTGTNSVNISLREPKFIAQIDTERAKYTAPADKDNKGGKYTDDGINTEEAQLNNILPGKKIEKDPTITNNGGNAVYIRFSLVTTDNTTGTAVALTPAQEAILMKSTATGGLGLTINTAFTKNADGYYYYTSGTALNTEFVPGASVSLFVAQAGGNTMEIPASWGNQEIADFASVLNIKVVGEAVQADSYANTNIPWLDADGVQPLVPSTAL